MGFADDILRDAQTLRPKKPESRATFADSILSDAQSALSRSPVSTLGETIVSSMARPERPPAPTVTTPEPPPISSMRDIPLTEMRPTLTRPSIFGPEFTATETQMRDLQQKYRVARVKGPGIDPKSNLPLPGYDEYGWPIGPRTEAGTEKVPPQRILERRKEPSTIEILAESAGQVIPSTIRRIGQAAQAAGQVVSRGEPGVPFKPPVTTLAPALKAAGKAIEKAAGPEVEEEFVPERLKKDILDDPSLLIDPKFYALHGPQVAGSMGTFLLAGWIGGPLLAASTEALMEAGSTYAAVRDATNDDQKAGDAATESFVENLAITYPEGLLFFSKGASPGLLKRLPDKVKALIETVESIRIGRTAVRGAAEAGQELTQEEIAYQTEKPHIPDRPPPQRGTSALLGGLAGGVAGAAIRPPRVSLEQQTKTLAEAKRASGIPEKISPLLEQPRLEVSETVRRIDLAQIREAEARARESEAKAKIAENQAEAVAWPVTPFPAQASSQGRVAPETGAQKLGEAPVVPASPGAPITIFETAPKGAFQFFVEKRGAKWADYLADPNTPDHTALRDEFQGRRPASIENPAGIASKAPETPLPSPQAETRPVTEEEEEIEVVPGKPLPETPKLPPSEITPDMEYEHAGLQARARDLRRRIREGQQGYRTPKRTKVEGDTPASYLVSAGGANFHASGLGGETQDLPKYLFNNGMVTRKGGTSSDVVVDRIRTDHPEWGIQTESDLLELLHEGGDHLYNPTEALEEERDPDTEEEALDLLGTKELQEELRKTQDQIRWYKDRGVTTRKPESEREEKKPFDLFYNPRIGESVLVDGQRRMVVESKGISPDTAGMSVDDTVTVYDPDTGKIEVVPRSTTRRIPAEPGPRATGPDLILERIHQRVRQEKLDPEVGDAGIAFVQSLQDTGYLDDLGISIRKGVEEGPQGRYQADVEATGEHANAVVNVFYDAATNARVLPHEITHHLEQFVPGEELDAMRDLYEREKAGYEKRKTTMAALARAGRGEFAHEASYRYRSFSEYFAERVTDLELLRQGKLKAEANASTWIKPALKMKHLLQTFWDAIKATWKGDVVAKIYRNLQLGRYGINESGGGPIVGRAYRQAGLYEAGAIPAEPFYSQLRRTIDEKMGGQQDPASLKQMLLKSPGIKREEIEDTGLFAWLDQRAGKLKKADVLDYLDQNTVKVEIKEHRASAREEFERVKAQAPILRYPPDIYPDLWLPGGENHREMLLKLPGAGPVEYVVPEGSIIKRLEKSDTAAILRVDPDSQQLKRAKPGDWILYEPYNQILGVADSEMDRKEATQTLLQEAIRNEFYMADEVTQHGAGYQTPHFPDLDVLAHIRLSDHVGPNGEKVLLVDEVQSDWHQKGRTQGYYKAPPDTSGWIANPIGERDFRGQRYEILDASGNRVNLSVVQPLISRNPEESLEFARKTFKETSVPDAPWKKTWHERAMKEVIRYAAENRYDRVAWVTGEQTADRYDLSKQVDDISAIKKGDVVDIVTRKDGEQVFSKGKVPLEELSNLVGKDLAKKIQAQPDGHKLYSGLNLKIGGEWAYTFYDHAITRFMSDYARKKGWGARVEDVSFETDKGLFVHSIAITPEARDQVLYQGQPMYYDPKTEGETPSPAPEKEPPSSGTKERQLPKSLEAAGQFGGYERTYLVATDVEAQRIADERLKDPDAAYIDLTTKPTWDKPDMVTALSLSGYYGREGRRLTDEGAATGDQPGTGKLALAAKAYNQQIALTHEASQKATTHGQATQALSMVSMLDPDGVLVYAQRKIDDLNEGLRESKKQTLTPEEAAGLQAKATHAQIWESLGDRGREIAQLSDRVFSGHPLSKDEWKRLKDLFRAVQVSAPKRRSSKLPDLSKLGMAERARREPAPTAPRPAAIPRPPSISERVVSRLNIAATAARQRRAERRGQIQALVDPADIADAVIIGAAELGKKGITFAQWSGTIVGEFGDEIRNHLQEIHDQSRTVYRQARDMELLANRALRKIQEAEFDVDLPRPATKIQELARAYEALKAAPTGEPQDRAAQDVISAMKNLGKKDVSPLDALILQARKEAAGETPRPSPEKPPPDLRARALARLMKRAETELEATDMLTTQDALHLSTAVEKLKSTLDAGRMEAAAEVAQAIAMLEKPTFMGKVGSIYMTNMLSGTKTLLTRNPLGNEILYRFGRIGRFALSPTIDRIVSRVAKTGERTSVFGLNTQGFDWGALLRGDVKGAFTEDSYWTGLVDGARRSWKGLPAIVKQTEKFETGRVPQFRGKGWIQKGVEAATGKEIETEINIPAIYTKTVTTVLDAFDNAGWVRARNATLGDMAKAAWFNAGKPANKQDFVNNYLKNIPEEVLEWAESEANYYTLKDPTLLSSVLIGAKKLLNLEPSMIGMLNKKAGEYLKNKGWKGVFGMGTIEFPFGQVPGSLIMKSIDYSPIGILRGMYMLSKGVAKGIGMDTQFSQRETVKALTNGITGTTGFTLLGYWMASLGLMGGGDDEYQVGEFKRQQTGQPAKLWVNPDATMRWVMSGFNPDEARRLEGDTFFTVDWMQPAAANMGMAVETYNRIREKGGVGALDLSQVAAETMAAGAETMLEVPMLQMIRRTLRPTQGSESALKPLIDALEGVPATLAAPSILNEVRQMVDNQGRVTTDPTPYQRAINRALYRLPWLSQTLPIAYKSLGEEVPKEIYQNGTNTLFNVFLNPGFIFTYRMDPMVEMLLRPYEEAGEKKQIPETLRPKQEFSAHSLNRVLFNNEKMFSDPVTIYLTKEDLSDLQRIIASLTTQKLGSVETLSPDPDKAAQELSNLVNKAAQEARDWFIQNRVATKYEKQLNDLFKKQRRPTGTLLQSLAAARSAA